MLTPEEWRDTVETNLGPICAFVRARAPRDAADDIVQDVFVSATANLARFNGRRGSTWAWLRTIASNKVADYYRRSKARSELDRSIDGLAERDGSVAAALAGETPLPDEVCQQAEFRALARAALSSLEPRRRECLVGRYYEELSLEELGERLELSRSAVNSLLHRARQELRQAFFKMLDRGAAQEGRGP